MTVSVCSMPRACFVALFSRRDNLYNAPVPAPAELGVPNAWMFEPTKKTMEEALGTQIIRYGRLGSRKEVEEEDYKQKFPLSSTPIGSLWRATRLYLSHCLSMSAYPALPSGH